MTNGNGRSDQPSSPIAGNVSPDAGISVTEWAKRQNRMLAQYSIPLIGSNEATLTFNGEELTADDFDVLVEYVNLFKKAVDRKQREAVKPLPAVESFSDE